jgi:ankyrin repeat protein
MPRNLTSRSSLDNLRREAKKWLKAIRENDPDACARFERVHPDPPANPGLRHVQHALALEHGFSGWSALKDRLAGRPDGPPIAHRDDAHRALLGAAEGGDAELVGEILRIHPDLVDERGTLAGHTGLRAALHFGVHHESVVRTLLEHGADPDVRDEGDAATPLHFAAERGDLDVVRLLVEYGADPIGAGTGHELTVLGWATCFDHAYHPEVAGFLLAHGAEHTIHTAVAMGDAEFIRTLARRSPADLDQPMDRTNLRRRPLHLAVIKGQATSLTALLDLGADTEAEDAARLTPLDQAALSGKSELAERLIERGAVIRLPAAMALGRTDDVVRLLRGDPDCLRPGGRWETLIIRASQLASGPVVEALINGGASVNVRDRDQTSVDSTQGYTALHAAAFHGNISAARVLLRHGASRTARDSTYVATPAGWADYAGHGEIRDLILDGEIDILDAIAFDRLDRIEEIITRDPQALERTVGEHLTTGTKPWIDPAWTPLGYAVAHGKSGPVQLLIERGANPAVRDSEDRGLTEIASAYDHAEIAQLVDPQQAGAVGQEGGAR